MRDAIDLRGGTTAESGLYRVRRRRKPVTRNLAGLANAAKLSFFWSCAVLLAACSIADPSLLPDDASSGGAPDVVKSDAKYDRSVTPDGATSDGTAPSDRGAAGDAGQDAADGNRCTGVVCG